MSRLFWQLWAGVPLILLVAVALQRYNTSMPAPFEAVQAVSIEPERIDLLPGAPNGAPIPPRFEGVLSMNKKLQAATRLFEGTVVGSESVAVTPRGDLVMVDRRGFVFRAPNSTEQTGYQLQQLPVYIGPGRTLGFHMVGEHTLYACDSLKGLIRVDLRTGAMEVLSNAIHSDNITQPPIPINYANDLDIAADGTVYFTSCTDQPVAKNALGFYDTMHSYLLSAFRGAADGRLLKWDPLTRRTSVLADGFSYANGVALSADESFVAVVETVNARVFRHWLKGSKKGTTEVFIDKLPGVPDGISRSPDGGFWVALVANLSPMPAKLAPYRWVRQMLSHWVLTLLPLLLKPAGFGVIKVNSDGQPVMAMYDPDGSRVSTVSAVTESDGKLFLGNLGGDFVSVVKL